MNVFFYCITIIQILEMIYSYRKTKQLITIQTIFFVTIVINFILYLQNWSGCFTKECQPITYYVISISQLFVLLFDYFNIKKERKINKIKISNYKYKIKNITFGPNRALSVSTVILITAVLCSMIENKVSYGTFIPFLSGIDSHKNGISIFGTLWRSIYPIGLIFFFLERSQRKKRFYSYCLLCFVILYLLVGGGSRFWSVISTGTAIVFYFVYCKPKFSIISTLLALALGISFVIILIEMGNSRLNVMLYSEKILYNGPLSDTPLQEVASWYYGYFPYSFYNLNLTLMNITSNSLSSKGMFFILPFLFVTKLHHVFGITSYDTIALKYRVITNTSATVATAYFEFFADFGYFFFITLIFYLIWLHYFRNKPNIFCAGAYSYFMICWSLFNFYNVISNGIPYTFLVFWFLCCKIFIFRGEVNES